MDDFYVQIGAWFEQNAGTMLGLISGLTCVLAFYVIYLHVRISRVTGRFRTLLNGVEGKNLEQLVLSQGLQLQEVLQEMSRIRQGHADLRSTISDRLTMPAMMRYSAFEDTGSDQSFSLALVDSHGNGVVLSSLHGRSECRTYAKPIINGQSRYILTEEESEVVFSAIRQIGVSKEELAIPNRKQSQ